MATNNDDDDDNTSKLSGPSDVDSTTSSDDGTDGDSDSGEPVQVEWLATTRAKRSTAGNRMKSMLANEEPAAEDSDLELLFAEDEDDVGFSDDAKDDGSDVQMDSSSDEEDQEGAGDDLEGEKELERQAREKKMAQRKRKAQEAIPAKFRKKVRIEQPGEGAESASPRSTAPPPTGRPSPRPKKKSERMSWMPAVTDMPTRASERKTTKISKEQLHQKMVKDEVRRKKQMEMMEKKAKRLEALKKPPMTQEERLREAAIVEKRNSKSLNRWEVAEKQREEERLRKIAALNNRKLDGPVVTFWSGIQTLEEGQQKHVGNLVSMEEKAPRKKRQSAAAALAAKEQENAKADAASKPPSPTEGADVKSRELTPNIKPEVAEPPGLPASLPPASTDDPQLSTTQDQPNQPVPDEQPTIPAAPAQAPTSAVQSPVASPPTPPPPPDAKQPASAVLAAPVLAPPGGTPPPPPLLGSRMAMLGFAAPNNKPNCLAPPNTSSHIPSPLSLPPTTSSDLAAPQQTPVVPPSIPAAPATSAPVPQSTLTPPPLSLVSTPGSAIPLQSTQGQATPPPKGPDTPQEPPPERPREGKVTRSCIILQNFDENAIKDRQVQTQILFGRKMNKLAKPAHAPVCVVTQQPAKYKDPKTGLPFGSAHAFKEIHRVQGGQYKFSRLLGAYVGTGNLAARGVPDRFLDPTKQRSTPKTVAKEEAAPDPKEPNGSVADAPPAPAPTAATPSHLVQNPPAMHPVTEARLVPDIHPTSEARLVPLEEAMVEGPPPITVPAPVPTAVPTPVPAPVSAPERVAPVI